MKYSEDPEKWSALMTAAQGNIITAIFQLRRIEWSDDDIKRLLEQELNRGKEAER